MIYALLFLIPHYAATVENIGAFDEGFDEGFQVG